MSTSTIPSRIVEAMHEVLDYLWDDEEQDCRGAKPDGPQEHIYNTLVELRQWLDRQASEPQN